MYDSYQPKCPICGSASNTSFCQKNEAIYRRCADCTHRFLTELPETKKLAPEYRERISHHGSEEKLSWDYSPVKERYVYGALLRKIERYSMRHTTEARLLDIGCSNGSFLVAARNRGWHVAGMELEKHSVRIARQQRLDVYESTLEDADIPENEFEVVTMWQLLEHIADPTQFLERVRSILRPGGVLAISTPNIESIGWCILKEDWCAVEPSVHLHLFTSVSLRYLTRKVGLEQLRLSTVDVKPATVKALMRSRSALKQRPQSVAGFVRQASPLRLKTALLLRRIVNIPLALAGIGEDLYGYYRKPVS